MLTRSHLNKESKLRQYNIGSLVFTRAVSLQYFQGRQSETMSERKLLNFGEKFKAFAPREFHLLSPVLPLYILLKQSKVKVKLGIKVKRLKMLVKVSVIC